MEGKITQNSNNISSNSEKLKEITNNVGDEFMVHIVLSRKKCTQFKKRHKICMILTKLSEDYKAWINLFYRNSSKITRKRSNKIYKMCGN